MRLFGVLGWISYNFTRHRIAGIPLTWWLLAFAVAWPALLILGSVRATVWSIAAAALAALLVAAIALGARNGYVVFRPASERPAMPGRPLRPEEKVPARATGFFEVSGMTHYLADARAWFETVETREHIVIAWNPLSRFLLLAKTPKRLSGMWYVFFQPAHIRALQVGHMSFGGRVRPALRIAYQAEGAKSRAHLYLAFDDEANLAAVLDDLLQDAPL